MNGKLALLVFFLTLAVSLAGQGEKINGLKTGKWTNKFTDNNLRYTSSGNYKIIPLSKLDTIREFGKTCYEIKYKGSTPLLFFEKKANGLVSVKDSIWNTYDAVGNLREIDYWIEGLNQSSKHLDENGDLISYDFDDYENDTSFQFTYINRQLFKKAFYPPENKNRQTEIYYPQDNLIISDAEIAFFVDLLAKPSATEEVSLNSKVDLAINDISSKRQFIKFASATNTPLTFPLKIKANEPVVIKITASPTAANYQMTDTLLITTNDNNTSYKIYSDIYAYHINGRTVEKLNSIKLSKAKDQYLILPSMGTVTDATIVSKKGTKYYYGINGITKIDLSILPVDTYSLQISSCNTGGILKLIVTE